MIIAVESDLDLKGSSIIKEVSKFHKNILLEFDFYDIRDTS